MKNLRGLPAFTGDVNEQEEEIIVREKTTNFHVVTDENVRVVTTLFIGGRKTAALQDGGELEEKLHGGNELDLQESALLTLTEFSIHFCESMVVTSLGLPDMVSAQLIDLVHRHSFGLVSDNHPEYGATRPLRWRYVISIRETPSCLTTLTTSSNWMASFTHSEWEMNQTDFSSASSRRC